MFQLNVFNYVICSLEKGNKYSCGLQNYFTGHFRALLIIPSNEILKNHLKPFMEALEIFKYHAEKHFIIC